MFLQLAANLEAAGNYVEPSTFGRASLGDTELNSPSTVGPPSPEAIPTAEESREMSASTNQARTGKKKKKPKKNKSLFGSEDAAGYL